MTPQTEPLSPLITRRTALGGLAALLAVAAASCSSGSVGDDSESIGTTTLADPDRPASFARGETEVFVVGDSLMLGALIDGKVLDLLNFAGYTARVDAVLGRQVHEGTEVLASEAAAGRLEPVVMVALGTNNLVYDRPPKRSAKDVDDLMTTIGPDRWAIWVDLIVPAFTPQDVEFNAMVRAKVEQWPNLTVVDWVSACDPAWILDDGIHLTAEGYVARAAFCLDTLDAITKSA